MDPPSQSNPNSENHSNNKPSHISSRTQSFSQKSDDSQTAAEFINSQLQLEADAREALPYKFEECTKPIGKLRQVLFSCITCNPPPPNPTDDYSPAGVCYSCSIQCHGEHTLVELFNKRDFVCDCGTTRLPSISPCTLRMNGETNVKGAVHSEEPAPTNKYNQNFMNRFCGCECDYDAYQQKGTMFQCLGLGTAETGGCGEDWWHPGCIVGLGPDWNEENEGSRFNVAQNSRNDSLLGSITEVAESAVEDANQGRAEQGNTTTTDARPALANEDEEVDEDPPLPPGFPNEDDFEGFICYKCVDANPWIRRYAGASGFLAPVFKRSAAPSPETSIIEKVADLPSLLLSNTKKRKADDDEVLKTSGPSKRLKDEAPMPSSTTEIIVPETSSGDKLLCRYSTLPSPPPEQLSLFFKADFREHMCRCSSCFPALKQHAQLLEEEENYEQPMSESEEEAGASTVGSGSIYDRGESALKNVDRVKAIEGVMAYNHLKEKLTPFFKQYAESGEMITAEDIKAHFAKMRGDEQAIKDAGEGAKKDGNNREEQSGY